RSLRPAPTWSSGASPGLGEVARKRTTARLGGKRAVELVGERSRGGALVHLALVTAFPTHWWAQTLARRKMGYRFRVGPYVQQARFAVVRFGASKTAANRLFCPFRPTGSLRR